MERLRDACLHSGISLGIYRETGDGIVRARNRSVARFLATDATHLFFTMWAATQTYADFDVQVRGVMGRKRLSAADHARAADHVVGLILRGCGV